MGLAQIALVAIVKIEVRERERERSMGDEIYVYTGSLINPAVQLYIYFSIDTV